MTNVLLMKVC